MVTYEDVSVMLWLHSRRWVFAGLALSRVSLLILMSRWMPRSSP